MFLRGIFRSWVYSFRFIVIEIVTNDNFEDLFRIILGTVNLFIFWISTWFSSPDLEISAMYFNTLLA